MAEEQVVSFLEKVAGDEVLRKKYAEILRSDRSPADSAAAIVALARENGIEFLPEEFVKIHEAIVAANDGELSEESLDQVAGGASSLSCIAGGARHVTCIASSPSREQLIQFGKLAYHCVACSKR